MTRPSSYFVLEVLKVGLLGYIFESILAYYLCIQWMVILHYKMVDIRPQQYLKRVNCQLTRKKEKVKMFIIGLIIISGWFSTYILCSGHPNLVIQSMLPVLCIQQSLLDIFTVSDSAGLSDTLFHAWPAILCGNVFFSPELPGTLKTSWPCQALE